MNPIHQSFGVLALATALVAPLAGQSAQKFSIQASALGASLSGTEFEGWGTGTGIELQGRYNHSAVSFGGGFQLTKHSLDGFDSKVTLGGIFFEPRYVIATNSNSLAPYLALRLSILRESGSFVSLAGEDVDVSASGFTVNGGGGLLVRLANSVNLDLGLTIGKTNFGEADIKVDGQPIVIPGLDPGSGTSIIFRAGIAVGIGK
jgi:hypothetical protein